MLAPLVLAASLARASPLLVAWTVDPTQLRLFKQGERLTPFRVGLLLALARIQRFEATCVTMIKQRVTEEFKLACLCSRSKWLNVQVRGVPSIAPTCPQSPGSHVCALRFTDAR